MSGRSAYLPAPTRNRCRVPRRGRRGLGLLDVMLAIFVLSVAALWGGQVVGRWVEDRVMANEVRALATLARAGRLLVEGDVNHRIRSAGVGTAPLRVTFVELEDADLRSPVESRQTPARRNLRLWLWRQDLDRALVIARARGEIPLTGTPGAEAGVTGVGVIPDGETTLRGPGVEFDMATIATAPAGFARAGDLFAVGQVWLAAPCHSYLYRVAVPGCPDANTMATDLNMGGQALTGADEIVADTARVGSFAGTTTVTGALEVTGTLNVSGDTHLEGLAVSGAAEFSEGLTIGQTLTITEDLTVGNTLTAGGLDFTGTVTVAGEARLGDMEATNITSQSLTTDTLSGTTGRFDALFADDVTVSRCDGCEP